MTNKLTDEQIKDIQEREAKGLQALKDLQLTPAAVVQKINLGDGTDIFVDKVQPYLADTKWLNQKPVKSPIKL